MNKACPTAFHRRARRFAAGTESGRAPSGAVSYPCFSHAPACSHNLSDLAQYGTDRRSFRSRSRSASSSVCRRVNHRRYLRWYQMARRSHRRSRAIGSGRDAIPLGRSLRRADTLYRLVCAPARRRRWRGRANRVARSASRLPVPAAEHAGDRAVWSSNRRRVQRPSTQRIAFCFRGGAVELRLSRDFQRDEIERMPEA